MHSRCTVLIRFLKATQDERRILNMFRQSCDNCTPRAVNRGDESTIRTLLEREDIDTENLGLRTVRVTATAV